MILKNLCLSGGAVGADLQWGMCAGMAGHSVIHWSFINHKTYAPDQEVVVLTSEQLSTADEHCNRASISLKKHYPPKSSYVRNLLRRNWYQVAAAERVYAVSNIIDGMVQGGTSWATQMFIDRFDSASCECYVYDQLQEKWFKWNTFWEALECPPEPYGVYAAIGTRSLNDAGKQAIRGLMGYKKVEAEAPTSHN